MRGFNKNAGAPYGSGFREKFLFSGLRQTERTRNGKRYSIVYRFVDDNEARPHTIAGSYAGTVEFTNLVRDAGSSPL